MIKAIIFDMDGVLIDSTKCIWESFNQILKDYNVHIPDGDIKKYTSMSLRDQIALWKEKYNLKDLNLTLEEFSAKSFKIQMKLIGRLKLNPAFRKLIYDAKKKGIKIAVATSSTRKRAEMILKHLGILKDLDVLVTAEEITKHKPDPEIFLKTAELLGFNSKECIVIEDAVGSMQGAKSIGFKSVGLVTILYTAKDLKEADLVFEKISDIKLDRLMKI